MNKRIQTGIVILLFLLSACSKIDPEKPLAVTTDDITLFSEGIYIFNGSVAGSAPESIRDHGFCWGTSMDPEKDENSICLGARSSEGRFSSMVYDVSENTTYYVRAFITAGTETYYGEGRTFTTPETMIPMVIDIDQNIHYSVQIGDQIWMADNLKTIHYSDGRSIPRVEDQQAWYDFSLFTRAYCWYDNYGAIGATYGALYTWPAAMDVDSHEDVKPGRVQGICPVGWHLPSDEEWKMLEMYLGMSRSEADKEDWRGTTEAGPLKHSGLQYWQSPNTGATNETGFTALPSGWRDGAGYFKNLGSGTRFWSSSTKGDYALVRQLDYNSSRIYRGTKGLYEGISVRCIKDK
ncbi:MAG: hypothetical protein A2V64_04845 [Bacteroidetes bacterium RBG_13_43_22]|nr:MAG: hypothetical protein A2V64_04845 [Bacteroidetes bacterium RBG_13_43_22]